MQGLFPKQEEFAQFDVNLGNEALFCVDNSIYVSIQNVFASNITNMAATNVHFKQNFCSYLAL